MYVQELIECLCAAHLSYLVEGNFKERGGVILMAAPGALKSTFLEELDRQYSDVIAASDLNVKSLIQYREQIANRQINTLVFPELAKLYERKDETASNMEGTLRALVSEGFQAASFEDQRINRIRARCMVIGAITPATMAKRFTAWEESGFTRRFLWILFRLKDISVLDRAVIEWQRLDFRVRRLPVPPPFAASIPNLTTRDERERCKVLAKYQPGGSSVTQHQTLVKMLAVLKWWFVASDQPRDAMAVLESFAQGLGREGAILELEPPTRSKVRRAREREDKRQATHAGKMLAARATRKKLHSKKGGRK